MPPQQRYRPVTMEELFAERLFYVVLPDLAARRIVLKMTLEFLMINGYIQLDRYTNEDRYRCLFAFIFASAEAEKSIYITKIRNCVRFTIWEEYNKDIRNEFRIIYQFFYKHYSFIRISAFAMNLIRIIKRNRLRTWFIRDTVLQLSLPFCGDRFRMESSFEKLEKLASRHHGISYLSILKIAAQSEVRQSRYEDEDAFRFRVLNARDYGTNVPLHPDFHLL